MMSDRPFPLRGEVFSFYPVVLLNKIMDSF